MNLFENESFVDTLQIKFVEAESLLRDEKEATKHEAERETNLEEEYFQPAALDLRAEECPPSLKQRSTLLQMPPEVAHESALPCLSVIVIIVLLKDA